MAVAILDLAPVCWMWFLATQVVAEGDDGLAWVSGALAALTVFGFTRLVHFALASDKWWSVFYSESDYDAVLDAWVND